MEDVMSDGVVKSFENLMNWLDIHYVPKTELRKLVVELPTVSEEDIFSYTSLLRENGYGSGARFIEGVVKLLERTS